ncbi:hypothetical protein ABH926_004354 [Catenulispora sp. GP43]|uniref:hypothetical protein n=1 Tax=Catenulispora sp. GP43 TaxID=3156263 RepID=UPI0035167836
MVTRYAIDEQHGTLIAAWATGDGDTATSVATLPPSSPADQRYAVARALTGLSEALWRTYTHPASAAGDDMGDNSEGWRRQSERDAFAKVLSALAQPNLPEGGMIVQSYIAVEEGAHRLGRALHAVGDDQLTAAITAEVQAEVTAIEQAELGDLSGRSRQAVVLTRADASPVQVAAADRLLRDNPLGSDELFTAVDPTAAAVAAAHWLHAAATIAAEAARQSITAAIVEADDAQVLPVATLTIVLDMIEDGSSPYEAVTELIRDAMAVAEGDVPDPIGLAEMVAEVQQTADRMAPGDEDALESMLAEVRATPLDPARPALDLLEDLLVGIDGCATLYTEYANGGDTDVDGHTTDDEHAEAHDAAIRQKFLAAVHEHATAHADRML